VLGRRRKCMSMGGLACLGAAVCMVICGHGCGVWMREKEHCGAEWLWQAWKDRVVYHMLRMNPARCKRTARTQSSIPC